MADEKVKTPLLIPYPDEQIIEAQIRTIVDRGVLPKASFWSELMTMRRQIGLRYLFHDWTEILFTLVLTLFAMLFLFHQTSGYLEAGQEDVYPFVFIVSPVLYLIIALLFFVAKRQSSTHEVEMTCKYNTFQLAAFRMLAFSLFCLAANAVLISFLMLIYGQFDFVRAYLMSASSLFLFSSAFLYVLRTFRSTAFQLSCLLVWIVLNLAACTYGGEWYRAWLDRIPLFVYAVLTIVGLLIYLRNIRLIPSMTDRKE